MVKYHVGSAGERLGLLVERFGGQIMHPLIGPYGAQPLVALEASLSCRVE